MYSAFSPQRGYYLAAFHESVLIQTVYFSFLKQEQTLDPMENSTLGFKCLFSGNYLVVSSFALIYFGFILFSCLRQRQLSFSQHAL